MPVFARDPQRLKISSPSIRGPKNNIREMEAKLGCPTARSLWTYHFVLGFVLQINTQKKEMLPCEYIDSQLRRNEKYSSDSNLSWEKMTEFVGRKHNHQMGRNGLEMFVNIFQFRNFAKP